MDPRCLECGYAAEDYERPEDRRWLQREVGGRAGLMFEGLPEGFSLPGFGDEIAVRDELGRLAGSSDLHPAVHLAQAAARASAASAGLELAAESGRVAQINTSRGGVPKLPVAEARISWRGIAADEHREPKHHGHAWQALCLWSADVITALQAEGHPIGYGYAGENLTLAGLDWSRARTGVRIEIAEVVCELTGPAVPCKKNAGWFLDGKFARMSHTAHPGWSRWYASVLRPGTIATGDEVRVPALSPSAGQS